MRVMIMQGELCLIECSKTNPSLRKENTENAKEFCMFLLNASGARIKKNVIEYNKHVMLEEEL